MSFFQHIHPHNLASAVRQTRGRHIILTPVEKGDSRDLEPQLSRLRRVILKTSTWPLKVTV